MIYDFTIDVRVEVRVRENIIERVPSIVNRKLSNRKSPCFVIFHSRKPSAVSWLPQQNYLPVCPDLLRMPCVPPLQPA